MVKGRNAFINSRFQWVGITCQTGWLKVPVCLIIQNHSTPMFNKCKCDICLWIPHLCTHMYASILIVLIISYNCHRQKVYFRKKSEWNTKSSHLLASVGFSLCLVHGRFLLQYDGMLYECACVIQSNITFNIISVISWRCLLVADIVLPHLDAISQAHLYSIPNQLHFTVNNGEIGHIFLT